MLKDPYDINLNESDSTDCLSFVTVTNLTLKRIYTVLKGSMNMKIFENVMEPGVELVHKSGFLIPEYLTIKEIQHISDISEIR